jgi:hypothetical protein
MYPYSWLHAADAKGARLRPPRLLQWDPLRHVTLERYDYCRSSPQKHRFNFCWTQIKQIQVRTIFFSRCLQQWKDPPREPRWLTTQRTRKHPDQSSNNLVCSLLSVHWDTSPTMCRLLCKSSQQKVLSVVPM